MGPEPSHIIRDAAWLTGARARAYGAMLAAGLAIMTVWLLLAPLRPGIPGGDFVSFYAASVLALGGKAAAAWIPELHEAAQHAVFGTDAGTLAFFYPPPYLLLCWPLALLPFGVSFVAWVGATLAAALLGFAVFLHRTGVRWTFALLLFVLPATWVNILAGQNGALTLAILATGFALLDRRPVGAGLVLGLMVMKPQLAVALPFVLIAAGRWRTLLAAIASAIALLLIAWLLVGGPGYAAFFANVSNARAALEQGAVDPALMQSLFGMLQPWSSPVAYLVQLAVAALAVTLACVGARRSPADGPALGALSVAATLASTPFLLDYDLALLAIPIGWIVARGAAGGFRSWEKLVCVLGGALPLFARTLSIGAGLHLVPFAALALLALIARRLVAADPARSGGLAQEPAG